MSKRGRNLPKKLHNVEKLSPWKIVKDSSLPPTTSEIILRMMTMMMMTNTIRKDKKITFVFKEILGKPQDDIMTTPTSFNKRKSLEKNIIEDKIININKSISNAWTKSYIDTILMSIWCIIPHKCPKNAKIDGIIVYIFFSCQIHNVQILEFYHRYFHSFDTFFFVSIQYWFLILKNSNLYSFHLILEDKNTIEFKLLY